MVIVELVYLKSQAGDGEVGMVQKGCNVKKAEGSAGERLWILPGRESSGMRSIYVRRIAVPTLLLAVILSLASCGHGHQPDTIATNCSVWPPPCNQFCNQSNAGGGANVVCSCAIGYSFRAGDNHHCHPEEWKLGRNAFLYYNHAHCVSYVNLGDVSVRHGHRHLEGLKREQEKVVGNARRKRGNNDEEEEQEEEEQNLFCNPESRNRVTAIGIDANERLIYSASFLDYSRSVVIAVIDIDGANQSNVITYGLYDVTGLAVDWVGHVLYISEKILHSIIACSFPRPGAEPRGAGRRGPGPAGSSGPLTDLPTVHCTSVVTFEPPSYPSSVVVDSLNGKLYWSECGESGGSIYVSNLDGSDIKEIRTTLADSDCISSLVLDQPRNTLYWSTEVYDGFPPKPVPGYLHSYDMTHKRLTKLMWKSKTLAVFSDDIYWTSESDSHYFEGQKVSSIIVEDKFTGEESSRLLLSNLEYSPGQFHIVHGSAQSKGRSPCDGVRCSHICLLKTSLTYRCACPVGMVIDPSNKHNCIVNWNVHSLLVVHHNQIYHVQFEAVGFSASRRILNITGDVTALVFDWSTKHVYYSVNVSSPSDDNDDEKSSVIYKLSLEGTPSVGEALFTTWRGVSDMEVDPVTANIYWVNKIKKTIEVGRMDGTHHVVLGGDGGKGVTENPVSIALDLRKGLLYYSDCGTAPHIKECDLSGLRCRLFVDLYQDYWIGAKEGACANDLFFEPITERLYWVDSIRNELMACNSSGSVVRIRTEFELVSVVAGPDRIYWTSSVDSRIRHSESNPQDSEMFDELDVVGLSDLGRLAYLPNVTQQTSLFPPNACSGPAACPNGVCIPNKTSFKCLSSSEGVASGVSIKPTGSTVSFGQLCKCENGGQCGMDGKQCRYNHLTTTTSSGHAGPLPVISNGAQTVFIGCGIGALALVSVALVTFICVRKRNGSLRAEPEDAELKTIVKK